MTKQVIVSQEDAVAVCEALGYHTAANWTRKQMGKRLREIAAEKEEDDGMTVDGDLGPVFDAIVAAGGEVELTASGETELPDEKEVEREAGVDDEEQPEEDAGTVTEFGEHKDPEEDDEAPQPESTKEVKGKPKGKRGRPKGSKNKAKKDAKPKPEVKSKKKRLSQLDAAIIVLGKSEEPMTVAAIMEGIEESGLWNPPREGKTPIASLAARFSTEIRTKGKDSIFCKVKPGLFKLSD